jgi:hypothetical protein
LLLDATITDATITDANTVIDMNRFAMATYYLNITDDQKLIKSFKIIKT